MAIITGVRPTRSKGWVNHYHSKLRDRSRVEYRNHNVWRVCEVWRKPNLGERNEPHTRLLADPKGEPAIAGEEFRTPPGFLVIGQSSNYEFMNWFFFTISLFFRLSDYSYILIGRNIQ